MAKRNTVKISIIVPFHNEEEHIEQCVESLIAQDFPKGQYEIIFVNNNSTDGSAAIVNRYSKVKLLTESDAGPGPARNKAIDGARGKLLALTDADCIVGKKWLKSIVGEFASDNIVAVLGRRTLNSSSVLLKNVQVYENFRTEVVLNDYPSKNWVAYSNNMAIKKEDVKKVNGFSKMRTCEDVELLHRVLKNSDKKVLYSKDMMVKHMEIKTAWDLLKKFHYYGTWSSGVRANTGFKELSSFENLKIFIRFLKYRKLTIQSTLTLYVFLVARSVAYTVGATIPKYRPYSVKGDGDK